MRSPYVAQAFHYGNSLKSCCIGIIVPDEEPLLDWAKENGISGDFKQLCSNEVKGREGGDYVVCS